MNLNILLQILGVLLLEAIGITASMISCHVGNRMYEKEKEEQRKALLGNDGDEQAPQNISNNGHAGAKIKIILTFILQLVGIWAGMLAVYLIILYAAKICFKYNMGVLYDIILICAQIILTKIAASHCMKQLAEIEKE